MLTAPISTIKGIGPRRAESLGGMGLFSLGDIINYLPKGYRDFSRVTSVDALRHGDLVAVCVRQDARSTVFHIHGMSVATAKCCDETGKVALVWFNQSYALKRLPPSGEFYACGRVDTAKGVRLINPIITDALPGIIPDYTLSKDVPQKVFRAAVASTFESLSYIRDPLPEVVRREFGIPALFTALKAAHFPTDTGELDIARRRLSFEDMLRFSLLTAELRRKRRSSVGVTFSAVHRDEFIALYPFAPTIAQLKVMEDIERDMAAPFAMNRLIQGDVGSGKTYLALYAMYTAAKNGYQSVLMAPTEVLAQQHFIQLRRIFGDSGAILTGGLSAKEARIVRDGIASGAITAVVGTHALISKATEFFRLGLVVTDEQHRFGVNQRAALFSKGENPDVLVMSATPIPRTLALLMYGDLDCSVVDMLPPGRQPIKTMFVRPGKRTDMYSYISERLHEGRQAYIVCPAIEKSDNGSMPSAKEIFDELKPILGAGIALLHGKMSADSKRKILSDFRDGNIPALVTTTVIEVGMDVPNATVMVIEAADRYGLSQLHQLRGRVGRGAEESYCFLLSEADDAAENERIKTLVSSVDGFLIAEKDLELRGPGQFLGNRQHGLADFSGVGLANTMAMIDDAGRAADWMLAHSAANPTVRDYIEAAVAASRDKLERIALN